MANAHALHRIGGACGSGNIQPLVLTSQKRRSLKPPVTNADASGEKATAYNSSVCSNVLCDAVSMCHRRHDLSLETLRKETESGAAKRNAANHKCSE